MKSDTSRTMKKSKFQLYDLLRTSFLRRSKATKKYKIAKETLLQASNWNCLEYKGKPNGKPSHATKSNEIEHTSHHEGAQFSAL